MEPTVTKHIDTRPEICGGKPCVAGTRIRVWDVHVWHDLRGQSPEEIVAAFPQLSIADVHAALAYYFDNRQDIERQMQEAREYVAELEAVQEATKFTKLRDQLLRDREAHDDSLPSA